jgi:hypothetical protein
MNKKVIAGVVAVVLLAGGAFAYSSSENLQGKFSPTKFSAPAISGTSPTPIKSGPFGSPFTGGSASVTSIDGLEFQVSSATPRSDILVLGHDDQELAVFKVTANDYDFEITDLVLTMDSSSDDNIHTMYVEYENEDGDTVLDRGYPASGELSFSGLEMFIPADDDAEFIVYTDLNLGADGGDSGDTFAIELDEVEALNLDDGSVSTATSIGEVANEMTVYESKPVFSLSSSSPSGSRSVSATDSVFVFDVEALEGEDVLINDLMINLSSDGSFMLFSTISAYLKEGSTTVSTTSDFVSDTSEASMNFTTMAAYGDIIVEEGTTKTFTIEMNTIALMDDTVSDDYLTLSIDLGSATSPAKTNWTDGSTSRIKWVGYVSDSSLNSNTLVY